MANITIQNNKTIFMTFFLILFKFRKFNLQFLIYKCRKYVSYLPPC